MVRMRSPNFPGINLENAIGAAREIYNKNRRAVIMRDDAAKDLGYSGLTGRSLKILGALNQYDLIENVSKGQVRVSKIAEDIFHGIPDDVKLEALHRAGNAPSLFQSIYERFEGEIPGENAVRSFLYQKGFTNEGVEKALRVFMETNRYLEIEGASKSYGEAASNVPTSPPETIREEATQQMEPATVTAAEGRGKSQGGVFKLFGGEPGPLEFNLSSSGLRLTGKTNSAAELKTFIEKLKALTILLPEVIDASAEEADDEVE